MTIAPEIALIGLPIHLRPTPSIERTLNNP
jgi:hypothetical protein